MGSHIMPKRSIRSRFLAERKSLPVEVCAELSDEIQQQFIDSGALKTTTCVALYCAVNNEVNTNRVARQVLDEGKTLTFPRIDGNDLDFVEVHDLAELVPGAFGVPEPKGKTLVPVNELDLVVVPGVAFDRAGHRLGYGRGYYDRALHACRKRCHKVGFAYDFQLTDLLPTMEHDQTLSMLITEKQTINYMAS